MTEPDPARSDADTRAVDEALAILKRHGYTAGDLDFLLYEGQGGAPGEDDPELEGTIGVLGRLGESGQRIG